MVNIILNVIYAINVITSTKFLFMLAVLFSILLSSWHYMVRFSYGNTMYCWVWSITSHACASITSAWLVLHGVTQPGCFAQCQFECKANGFWAYGREYLKLLHTWIHTGQYDHGHKHCVAAFNLNIILYYDFCGNIIVCPYFGWVCWIK